MSSELDLADNPGTMSLYLEYVDFQVHSSASSASCLIRLKCGELFQYPSTKLDMTVHTKALKNS